MEQSAKFARKFVGDCQKVYSSLELNPFTVPQFQKITNSTYVYPQVDITEQNFSLKASNNMFNMWKLGLFKDPLTL